MRQLYIWGLPFALLLNSNGIFDSKERTEMVENYGAELLYIYPRVKYYDPNGNRNSPPFQSCFWCYGVLPQKLIIKKVEEVDNDGNK